MQSLHYNNGSVKLTRERSTMVPRWDAEEVARWVAGLAGIEPGISEIFRREKIDGIALGLLLRDDLRRMGIRKIDQQLILMQSIEILISLVDQLNSESLALLFMRIHSAAANSLTLLKPNDQTDRNLPMKLPEIHSALCHLSETILAACQWLGRLPFIEKDEYIALRRKIIEHLIKIRSLARNLTVAEQTNIAKTKLILEIKTLRSDAQTLVRKNKDSLFSSDRYLTRVHLRRPDKNDVNIEYTTMSDFTHVISSIETESVSRMGTGFSVINVGDEIIEINNQVVIGWDPIHFDGLLRLSAQHGEFCLLVKKMPRYKEDEIFNKFLTDSSTNLRGFRSREIIERKQKQADDTRARLMQQEGEIKIESDDETLYQSKRSSLKKPEQHSSLPDLTEPNSQTPIIYEETKKNENVKNSKNSNVTETKKNDRTNNTTKTQKGYFSGLLRQRTDTKSIIPEQDESIEKGHPQLVKLRTFDTSIKRPSSSSNILNLQSADSNSNNVSEKSTNFVKCQSQTSLPSPTSPFATISSFFRYGYENSEKSRRKHSKDDKRKFPTVGFSASHDHSSYSLSSQTSTMSKSILNAFESPLSSRRAQKENNRKVSCRDLGEGDCEGSLKRYDPSKSFPYFGWRTCWCVLKGGILYIFKSRDDQNQELEINLEGKNISPAPSKRKYAFEIGDETTKTREFLSCSSRDQMAKWMNKMGLASINFEIQDSKIGGFHRGFVRSRDPSPVSTPKTLRNIFFGTGKKHRTTTNSAAESENESDKDSMFCGQKSISTASSVSDFDFSKSKQIETKNFFRNENTSESSLTTRCSSSTSIVSLDEKKKIFSNERNSTSIVKGHHRTVSSPIRFSSNFQENIDETNRSDNFMLNSSGGFSTTSEQTNSVSSPFPFVESDQPSNFDVFHLDQEFSNVEQHRTSNYDQNSTDLFSSVRCIPNVAQTEKNEDSSPPSSVF